MSGNVFTGRRRDLWRAMTPGQQETAVRLALTALSAAVAGSGAGVATTLVEAGRAGEAVEAHVLWAAREMTGPVRLVGDTTSEASRRLEEGARLRAQQTRTKTENHQEGLFR